MTVDEHHATIEWDELNECFLIRDLNSVNGVRQLSIFDPICKKGLSLPNNFRSILGLIKVIY